MNRFIKRLAVLLVCSSVSISVWAGGGTFGSFASPLPATQLLTPGQIFSITLTANTNVVGGINFSAPFALNPNIGNQFAVVPGGTCIVGNSLTNGQKMHCCGAVCRRISGLICGNAARSMPI